MKIIGITTEYIFNNEQKLITALLEEGLEVLHLRKPHHTEEETEKLLLRIPDKWYGNIVIHDHFSLASKYSLKGIHLNTRHKIPPAGFSGSISQSCHTLTELNLFSKRDYLFLSPIYNSISKQGYISAFSPSVLKQASAEGIIDHHIYALGGITPEHIPELKSYGFGGAAFLGYLWNFKTVEGVKIQLKHIQEQLK